MFPFQKPSESLRYYQEKWMLQEIKESRLWDQLAPKQIRPR